MPASHILAQQLLSRFTQKVEGEYFLVTFCPWLTQG